MGHFPAFFRCVTMIALLGLHFKLNLCSCSCAQGAPLTAPSCTLSKTECLLPLTNSAKSYSVNWILLPWNQLFLSFFFLVIHWTSQQSLSRHVLSTILTDIQRPSVHVPLSGLRPRSKWGQYIRFLRTKQAVESLRKHFPFWAFRRNSWSQVASRLRDGKQPIH